MIIKKTQKLEARLNTYVKIRLYSEVSILLRSRQVRQVHKSCTFRPVILYKLMKVKALGKHSLHEKTAASVLLKPFISSNE